MREWLVSNLFHSVTAGFVLSLLLLSQQATWAEDLNPSTQTNAGQLTQATESASEVEIRTEKNWQPQGIGGSPDEPVIFGFPVDNNPNVRHFNTYPQPQQPAQVKPEEPTPTVQTPVAPPAEDKAIEPPPVAIPPRVEAVEPPQSIEQPETTTEEIPQPQMEQPQQPEEAIEPKMIPSPLEEPVTPQQTTTTERQWPTDRRLPGNEAEAQSMYEAFCMKPMDEYKSKWMKRVNQWHVSRPAEKGTFMAVVKYAITKSGTVQNVQLAQSSGNTGIDEAAISQIQNLIPDPLPECFNQERVNFSHTFRLVNP